VDGVVRGLDDFSRYQYIGIIYPKIITAQIKTIVDECLENFAEWGGLCEKILED